MIDSVAESGLVVVVTEAEAAVDRWRSAGDSSAPLGVPPHVTVLYPFLPPARLGGEVIERLTDLFGAAAPFEATFSSCGWFGEQVLWLAPDDPEPFRRLTAQAMAAYPSLPPYGGRFDEVVPHLTVSDSGDAVALREAEASLANDLPIRTRVDAITLMAQSEPGGLFTRQAEFRLG